MSTNENALARHLATLTQNQRAVFDASSAQFWAWVRKDPAWGGCWLWGRCKVLGYGVSSWGGKQKRAQHVAWFLTHGYWPRRLYNHCRDRACVNPEHWEESDIK